MLTYQRPTDRPIVRPNVSVTHVPTLKRHLRKYNHSIEGLTSSHHLTTV